MAVKGLISTSPSETDTKTTDKEDKEENDDAYWFSSIESDNHDDDYGDYGDEYYDEYGNETGAKKKKKEVFYSLTMTSNLIYSYIYYFSFLIYIYTLSHGLRVNVVIPADVVYYVTVQLQLQSGDVDQQLSNITELAWQVYAYLSDQNHMKILSDYLHLATATSNNMFDRGFVCFMRVIV